MYRGSVCLLIYHSFAASSLRCGAGSPFQCHAVGNGFQHLTGETGLRNGAAGLLLLPEWWDVMGAESRICLDASHFSQRWTE